MRDVGQKWEKLASLRHVFLSLHKQTKSPSSNGEHTHTVLPMPFPVIEPVTLGAGTSLTAARGRTGSGCRQEERKWEVKRQDASPLPIWEQRETPSLPVCLRHRHTFVFSRVALTGAFTGRVGGEIKVSHWTRADRSCPFVYSTGSKQFFNIQHHYGNIWPRWFGTRCAFLAWSGDSAWLSGLAMSQEDRRWWWCKPFGAIIHNGLIDFECGFWKCLPKGWRSTLQRHKISHSSSGSFWCW